MLCNAKYLFNIKNFLTTLIALRFSEPRGDGCEHTFTATR
jgi:hypothetical protein